MKKLILGILLFVSINTFGQESRLDSFCGKWKQYAYKNHQDSIPKTSQEECANKVLEFSKDGKYEEVMYSLKGIGIWQFNSDSSRFGYIFTEYMGQKMPKSDLSVSFNSIILKLTKDTLIVGNEGIYGPQKIKGHDDWYYVKIK